MAKEGLFFGHVMLIETLIGVAAWAVMLCIDEAGLLAYVLRRVCKGKRGDFGVEGRNV